MRALIYGIDGGDKRILDGFDMPFLQELRTQFHDRDTTEDLFCRGWAKIITGTPGYNNKAYYSYPRLDGSCQFSQSFSSSDLYNDADCIPLWDLLGDRGFSVGVMNVPTTTPAREADGFIVGSAGGGLARITQFDTRLARPESVIPVLEKNDYLVDTRFRVSGIRDIEQLFDTVIRMERIRTDTYIELCKQRQVDLGFLVNTGVRTIQYLAMSEIEPLLTDRQGEHDNEHRRRMRTLINRLYRELDDNIRHLLDELSPEHVILTADHGQGGMQHRVNADVFLQQHGWLTRASSPSSSMKSSVHRIVRKVLPNSLLKMLRRNMPVQITAPPATFDRKATQAFGQFYVSGIYINDRRRFNGPVDEADVDALVDEIADTFNRSAEAQQYDMRAEPWRRKLKDKTYTDQLPDILIQKPDTMFFFGRDDAFVTPNPAWGPLPEDLEAIPVDMYTGTKGSKPILFMDQETARMLQPDDPEDLTVVYRLIDRIFANRGEKNPA